MLAQPNLLPKGYKPNVSVWAKVRRSFKPYMAIAVFPVALIVYFIARPTEPLVSPLANSGQPEMVRQSLNDSKQSLAYYLAASQKYLDQARALAKQKGVNQTESDKQKIISLLNESLKHANNAVKYYPNSPESYQQRAELFKNLAALDASAQAKADKDLTLAAQLGSKEEKAPDVRPEDLIQYTPIQEATLAQNVAIAFPEEEKVVEVEAEEDSNALRGSVIIPAGSTEVVVSSEYVTNDNLIYFTPEGNTSNEIVSLKSKSEKKKEFTLALSNPIANDLVVTWWIVQ